MKFFLISMAFIINTTGAYGSCNVSEISVRKFLEKNELIPAGSEFSYPEIGISTKFEIDEVREFEGKRLIIVKSFNRIKTPGETDQIQKSQEFEVIVQKPDCNLSKFEDVFRIPRVLDVKIGHTNYEEIVRTFPMYSFYYATLTERSSIIDAMKSVFSGIRYFGFSGYVVKSQPLSFDKTPNRSWSVVDAKFSLRRGMSGEAGDIQAYQLDGDFEGYFAGAIIKRTSIGADGAWIAPWGQAAVLEVIRR